jgi:hypothetical protein
MVDPFALLDSVVHNPLSRSTRGPCGSELAHEDIFLADEDLADVPAYSRASSLPQRFVDSCICGGVTYSYKVSVCWNCPFTHPQKSPTR